MSVLLTLYLLPACNNKTPEQKGYSEKVVGGGGAGRMREKANKSRPSPPATHRALWPAQEQ